MIKKNWRKSLKKTFTFTSTFWWTIQMSPQAEEVWVDQITRNERNWLKSIRNTFEMNFWPWFWKTNNVAFANIVRESELYWSMIFEIDEEWKDLTQKVIDDLEWVVEADVTPSEPTNPYKSLPTTVLNKMSLPELQEACKSVWVETAEEDTKKELVAKLTK